MADINKLVPDSVFHENIDIEKQKFAQKQDKMQVTTLPDPTLETSLDKVFIYVGETSAVTGLTKGQSYLSDGTAWQPTATKVDVATSSTAGIVKPDNMSITVDSNGTISTPALLQMTALPTASADYLGKIVQLTQAQTGYTKGFIYECVSDGNDPPAYSWTETNVQGSIDISSQTGNQIETKADGIYVGETTVIDNVDTLPTGNDIEDVFYRVTSTGKLYKGDSTNQTTTLVTPDFDSNDFDVDNNNVALSAAQRIFTGTTAEWEALTTEEKANYTVVNFSDDETPEEFDTRLSAVEDVIPSGASESNQLVTANEADLLTIPLSKFQIRSGGAVGYADLGATTTTISQAFSWLEVEYGRVDGFIDKYFISVAGASSNPNYIKVVRLTNYGQTPTITLDANNHIWMSMDTYVCIHVKAYGNFSISGTLSRTAPTGITIPINRLVTESDISNVAGYIGQYDMSGGHSLTMRMDSTAFRRVTIYNYDTMYSFVVHEWSAQPKYHWIVGTALPSDITLSYENYGLTIKNTGSGMYRACIEAPTNPVSATT